MNNNNRTDLQKLLIFKLQSLYDIEIQLVGALVEMADAAANHDLKAAFHSHLGETYGHIRRLEEIFGIFSQPPKAMKVQAIRGIVKDAEWIIAHIRDVETRDAGLVAAAQYIEHYEIASYGTARQWARMLNHENITELLQSTLDEEKMADQNFDALAKSRINWQAISISRAAVLH